ncbi:terpenoid cyclases/protein prenyltransferase alpha-alpha toroid [Melampsora americana]|nr:terpenoid cyclases/protein prenyltransferase alpha-alpha toroid [Melampsora americana]
MPVYPFKSTPFDGLKTETSEDQDETEQEILELLLPCQIKKPIETSELAKEAHIEFIRSNLKELPTPFTVLDSSRSWLTFWISNSIEIEHKALIDTILSFQDPNGGFGGGPGQSAHLASTFACTLALSSLLAKSEPVLVQQTWSKINRDKMYHWILSLKQSNGSFLMQMNAEADVRGCYCVLIVSTLLNFLTPDLALGLSDFIAHSQTYEGGFSSGSSIINPKPNHQHFSAVPFGESHGGYTSCGVLSHFLLKSLSNSIPITPIDYQACYRWLSSMQGLPIEGGGFRGRTNKLVDGCYAWWCGGLFPVIEHLIEEEINQSKLDGQEDLFKFSTSSYDRRALQEYVLLASQGQPPADEQGGLRDKPYTGVDLYHTHYVLSGLSSSQHFHQFSLDKLQDLEKSFKSTISIKNGIKGSNENDEMSIKRMKKIYTNSLAWIELKENQSIVGLNQNLLNPIHPIFNISSQALKVTMDYFYSQG